MDRRKHERGLPLMHAAYKSTPAHVRIARNDALQTLRRSGLAHRLHDVRLLVSEVVTNAVQHTCSPSFTVTVHMTHNEVIVAVEDASPEVPLRHRPQTGDEHGRGLVLLDLLADAWGVDITDHGTKVVWCCLDLTTAASHPSSTQETAP
ncbi:ATP-binding protein [Streptomyces sp. 769]|uniref:ATP-binding protein n=1 Tax=Streptomyces sp. 769 TaxID=1262452 RepID=UPI00058207FB|nr:ATP-binding protein [Streptomyces sp. 769]AJC60123.1 putative anti-sigma regulatory factor C serine/threonine protein kinase [Streptomyces sp. 769]